MKKLSALVLIVLIAVGIRATLGTERAFPDGGDYAELYIAGTAENAVQATANFSVKKIKFDELGLSLRKTDNLLGIAVHYPQGKTTADAVIDQCGGRIFRSERIGDVTLYYGYAEKFDGGVEIDEKKVNFQIAVTPRGTVVGTPLIMGSY